MTRDDITRMALEAGGGNCWWPMYKDTLERFAALVAAPLEKEIKRLRFCIPESDAAAEIGRNTT